jgi:signal transduction histidine kinase
MISNALIYTEADGSVAVSVKQQGDNVIIRVSDTGSGIPDGQLKTIWRKHSQPKILTDKKSGAGFGLTVISKIAQMHGGSVFLESRAGRGTTITAVFPIQHDSIGGEITKYQPDSVAAFLVGLASVLRYDKYTRKYMD